MSILCFYGSMTISLYEKCLIIMNQLQCVNTSPLLLSFSCVPAEDIHIVLCQ